jgi:hypothetical protein
MTNRRYPTLGAERITPRLPLIRNFALFRREIRRLASAFCVHTRQ